MVRPIVLVLALLPAPPAPAADLPGGGIIDCRVARPAGAREYWSWREVDGRRCWYAGRPGKPKSELRWGVVLVPAKTGAERVEGPPQVPIDAPAPVVILRVVPTTGAEGSFDDRWLPVLGCGYHFVGTWDCGRTKKGM